MLHGATTPCENSHRAIASLGAPFTCQGDARILSKHRATLSKERLTQSRMTEILPLSSIVRQFELSQVGVGLSDPL